MSKGQRGNKEARKPKKVVLPAPPAGTPVPVLPAAAPERNKRR